MQRSSNPGIEFFRVANEQATKLCVGTGNCLDLLHHQFIPLVHRVDHTSKAGPAHGQHASRC